MIVHAGLIARRCRGRWRGVLLEGNSGDGKSDLALRAMDIGFRLVADDRTLLFVSGTRLFGRAPNALGGLMELRGVGVLSFDRLDHVEIALVATCRPSARIERLPEPRWRDILGVSVPTIEIAPLEASAPAKLCRVIEALGSGAQPDYDAALPRTEPRSDVKAELLAPPP